MKLWIVGKVLNPDMEGCDIWEFCAVFDTQAKAVAACWEHYVDTPLTFTEVESVRASLHNHLLPKQWSTGNWQKYADDYDRRMAADLDV